MRLEGLTFLLVVVLLYLWGVLLAFALALGWGKRKVFVIAATAVTSALVSMLIMVFGDGSATMHQRPLGVWAMFVVLLLAAVPAMLAAPFLQLAWRRGREHNERNGYSFPFRPILSALVDVLEDPFGQAALRNLAQIKDVVAAI